MNDLIRRQDAVDAIDHYLDEVKNIPMGTAFKEGVKDGYCRIRGIIMSLPSAQPEVIPHRNYKYLSDFWCECGWHLGKQYSVKYCAECGRKVKWDG